MASDIRQRTSTAIQPILPDRNGLNNVAKRTAAAPLIEKVQKAKKRVLLFFDDLPAWAKDNEYIQSGFRPESNSYLECVKSMGYLHNQTGNIYSHLLATIWMIVLGTWWYSYAKERYLQMTSDDAAVFFLFFLGGATCFCLSTIYHLLGNHSHSTHVFCLQLDFLGIITVTAGCFPPGLWYTFPCASRETKIWWIGVDLVAQLLATIFVLFFKRFQGPSMRPVRGFVFSLMASSAFYPIIVKLFQVGWNKADAEYGASLYALTIMIYLSSVAIYVVRLTESWKPGYFDIWGHSHQIFHVGMAVGLTVHFLAFTKALDQFYNIKRGQCPD